VHSRKAILAFCRLAHRTVRCTTGHCPVRISFLFWRSRPLAPWSRWRTGHCPVPPSSRWRSHVSRADRAADRWPGRPLAHRIVRCTPDNPVNYSRTPLILFPGAASSPEPVWHTGHCSVHHRTVRCTQTELALAEQGHLFSNSISPVSIT
jgi:hypothetical protein